MSETLSARLRAATAAAHADAAGGGYLNALVRGDYDVNEFARLTAQYRAMYRALERAASAHTTTIATGFHRPELARSLSLDHDLRALAARATTLPETDAYVARITEVQADPVRFIAHYYTRYLGDLSGGIYLGRALAKRFGEHVTTFYRFPIDDADAFKQAYRARLDGLGLDADRERALIDETLIAYRHNAEMHAALDRTALQ